jgi:RNA polymerase sigma-54 factor
MALAPTLDLRQSQTLIMTPQLQQAIKLLQLSNLELVGFVEEQLESNPLLEREDMDDGGRDAGAAVDEATGPAAASPDVDTALSDAASETSARELDCDPADLYDGDPAGDNAGAATEADFGSRLDHAGGEPGLRSEAYDLEGSLRATVSLRDYLCEQLQLSLDNPGDRLIGLHLIDMLDDAGYLRGDLGTVAETLGCSVERVERVLECVQQFDPPGLFARSVAECLRLQQRDRGRLDPAMDVLLDHLDLLAAHDYPALSRLCGVGAERLAAMIAEIRSLNPRPALAFDDSVVQPIVPDVIMRANPDGSWVVELNQDTLPRILVKNHYFSYISTLGLNKGDRQFINECYQSANWLVKSLHQRSVTILKVSTEIVKQQSEFFRKGIRGLKPMVLRDVAQAVSFHESTVSRVTSNKYIATPRGLFELKYFFGQAVGNANGGEGCSSEWVRERIRKMIESEPCGEVLSDDALVNRLGAEGIDVARRTVAKYREAMGVPSSVQRRREKRPHGP